MAMMGEYSAGGGVTEVDLGGGVNDDKRRWETHRRTLANYWLINHGSAKGKLLQGLLKLNDWRKTSSSNASD